MIGKYLNLEEQKGFAYSTHSTECACTVVHKNVYSFTVLYSVQKDFYLYYSTNSVSTYKIGMFLHWRMNILYTCYRYTGVK